MKQLLCADASGKSCPYVAVGENDDEIMQKIKNHGMEHHREVMANFTPEDMQKWDQKSRKKIATL